MKNDAPLSALLRTWRPVLPDPARGFEAHVWAKIRAPQPHRVLLAFPLSLRAVACWTALAAALGGSAVAYAYDSFTRDDRMALAHVRTLDPLQRVPAQPDSGYRH